MAANIKNTILFIAILFFPVSSFAAEHLNLTRQEISYIKKTNPLLYEKYNMVKKEIKNNKKVFAIFLFLSSTVPIEDAEIYFHSMNNVNRNIKGGVFFRGLNKQTFLYIKKTLMKFKHKPNSDKINVDFRFDPDFFDNMNLKSVPLLSLSLCNVNNIYPSDCETLYIIHGVTNVEFFVNKISEIDNSLLYLQNK